MKIEKPTPKRGKEYINIDKNQMMYQQMLSKLPQIKSNNKMEVKAEAVNLIEWNQPKSRQIMAMSSIRRSSQNTKQQMVPVSQRRPLPTTQFPDMQSSSKIRVNNKSLEVQLSRYDISQISGNKNIVDKMHS